MGFPQSTEVPHGTQPPWCPQEPTHPVCETALPTVTESVIVSARCEVPAHVFQHPGMAEKQKGSTDPATSMSAKPPCGVNFGRRVSPLIVYDSAVVVPPQTTVCKSLCGVFKWHYTLSVYSYRGNVPS
ncbi:hypothetical protein FKM82_028442 [Ascaphus truei]